MAEVTIRNTVLMALFAAIMAVLGAFPNIPVPGIPAPITAQSLGVMLAGGILGARYGALSLILFLILVAAGLPLLSGARGGFAVFFGATAGFLFGWVIAAFVIGLLIEKFWNRLNYFSAFLACIIGGIIILYAIGIPWVAYAAKIPLGKAFWGSVAYIPGDLIKAAIASVVIVAVAKSYPIIQSK